VETSEEGIDYPILAEEFILGREYSADFIIENDNIQLIRVAKKLHDNALVFGTTMAYVVPAKLPGWINHDALAEKFRKAADALGINHAICMVDFIIGKDEVIFLELTPRIGGDCLPHLIRRSCGLDTIGLALDFAEGKKYDIPPRHRWKEHVGMRLFSSDSGKLININCDELSRDNRVREIFIKREPGEEIVVPPDDYDSWLLGHVLFEPESGVPLRTQCNDLRKKIFIDVEQYYDQKLSRPLGENYRDSQPAGPAA